MLEGLQSQSPKVRLNFLYPFQSLHVYIPCNITGPWEDRGQTNVALPRYLPILKMIANTTVRETPPKAKRKPWVLNDRRNVEASVEDLGQEVKRLISHFNETSIRDFNGHSSSESSSESSLDDSDDPEADRERKRRRELRRYRAALISEEPKRRLSVLSGSGMPIIKKAA